MQTAPTPFAALAAILAHAPEGSLFSVSDALPAYTFVDCFLDEVPENHKDSDHGGPIHASYTCMQEVVGGGEVRLGYIYTVLNLEGDPLVVYWA